MQIENGRDYLSFVTEKLKERIRSLGFSLEEGEKDIEKMHEYYWDNYTEMDEYGYENFDNQQALLTSIKANEETYKLLRRFHKMLDSPFFGRVDFLFEDEDEAEILYIGIGNFSEGPGMQPLIYDWRAPVCSLFYDYDKGEASYEAPDGRVYGEIMAKWQYKIRYGRMIYEFESDIKIDDEILKEELGARGEDKLKNIIRTIQKEQNAIIRNTKDRILVIQGAAGSGKTSIALHRIAYLLYHDRQRLKSSNILILSPNGIFGDYISQILPELGEENIREMTFDQFALGSLDGIVADCEERFDQIEREISAALLPPEKRARARRQIDRCHKKQSREFAGKLEGYCALLEDELMNFHDVEYKGSVFTEEEIVTFFYDRFTDVPLLSRMNEVAEYYIDQVETLKGKNLPDEERELLRETFLGMYETRDIYILYSRFLKSEGMKPLPHLVPEKRILPYEDVYPLLYMKYRLTRYRPDNSVRHLVIDEMQDYSWIQYAILQKLFSCRMTILGDKAQTIEEKQSDVLSFLPRILGKEIRQIRINKCYRNTMQIALFANALLGIKDMELVERRGEEVHQSSYPDEEKAIEQLAEDIWANKERFETAAVITLTEAEAAAAEKMLKKLLSEKGYDVKRRLNYLHRYSKGFKRGLTVTTFYLAKGLEFDHVYGILPQGAAKEPLLRQAEYIMATRAMHLLYFYHYGG